LKDAVRPPALKFAPSLPVHYNPGERTAEKPGTRKPGCAEEKGKMPVRKGVQKIYAEVSASYELVNHVLTFGLDIFWRRKATRIAGCLGGGLWLDVCSGTGEMAHALARSARGEAAVVAADFSFPMLERARKKRGRPGLSFVLAEAGALPFPDDSFDLVTVAFATRNLSLRPPVLLAYLGEFLRVLKPGGSLLNLETSQPENRFVRRLFHLYVAAAVHPVGSFLSASRSGYRYLAHTIPRFYGAEDFTRMLEEAGFHAVECRRLLAGIAAVHVARKPGSA